jgi:hypothetical protein
MKQPHCSGAWKSLSQFCPRARATSTKPLKDEKISNQTRKFYVIVINKGEPAMKKVLHPDFKRGRMAERAAMALLLGLAAVLAISVAHGVGAF